MSTDPASIETLQAEVERLAARVAELEDRVAIRELTARYNNAFDDVRTDDWIATFAPDGAFQFEKDGEITQGPDRLRAMSQAVGFGSVHLSLDPVIEIDGDTATQTCSLIFGGRSEGREPGSAQYVTSGRMVDELVRTPEGWLFKKRTWIGDSHVELPEW